MIKDRIVELFATNSDYPVFLGINFLKTGIGIDIKQAKASIKDGFINFTAECTAVLKSDDDLEIIGELSILLNKIKQNEKARISASSEYENVFINGMTSKCSLDFEITLKRQFDDTNEKIEEVVWL